MIDLSFLTRRVVMARIQLARVASLYYSRCIVPYGRIVSIVVCLTSAVSLPVFGQPDLTSRETLGNGVKLLVAPIPGVNRVAVQAIYPVGFYHEPAGMTQVSHLLEHRQCQCATETFRAGESYALLNARGMANAETLPGYTHYDFILPPGEVDLAFRVEAERLSSLQVSQSIILQEAPKCYHEAAFVEQNPKMGMAKHAFMAFFQAWRNGSRQVSIRSGLERMSVERVNTFRHAWYRPENLTLVIVGAFDKERVMESARRNLGNIKPIGSPGTADFHWSSVPKKLTVTRDSKLNAVRLALPPAERASDNLMLSLWGALLIQEFSVAPEIKRLSNMVFASNLSWPAGPLPFFVYAAAKSEAAAIRLESVLKRRLTEAGKAKIHSADIVQLRMYATQLKQAPAVSKESIEQHAQMVARLAAAAAELGETGVTAERM